MKKKYIIVIAETVSGKSKGPPGYSRAKPYKYQKAEDLHPIVYYKKFLALPEDALDAAKDAAKEMFKIYSLNLGSNFSKVMEYTIVLHNITDDIPKTIHGTNIDIKNENGLLYNTEYPNIHHYRFVGNCTFKASCSNYILKSWKIFLQ